MLIKFSDDKSSRLKLLAELQQSALLDTFQKYWLKSELLRPLQRSVTFASGKATRWATEQVHPRHTS